MRSQLKNSAGFTLVELVAVIVLLGVIGAATTQFISASVNIYNDTSRRGALAQMGRFAVERVTREVRNALPGSVRVSSLGGTQCLEFVPILAASSYLGRVSDTPPITTVTAVDFNYSYSAGDRVAIYTIDNNDVYAPGSRSMADVDSISAAVSDQRVITLDSANRFNNESPINRLYMVGGRVSFCASDGALVRYQGYTSSGASQPVPPGTGGVPLAEDIRLLDSDGNPANAFSYLAGTLQRAGTVHMNFNFSDTLVTDEWVQFSQEVSLRNSP
jgi:MSHA biogenesis protein MshO